MTTKQPPALTYDREAREWAVDGTPPVCVGRFRSHKRRYLAALLDDGTELWWLLPPAGEWMPMPDMEATGRPDEQTLCMSHWRRPDLPVRRRRAADEFSGIPPLAAPVD